MTVEVEVTASAADCPLEGLLRIVPGTRIQLERIVPVAGVIGTYLLISAAPVDEIRSALRTDPDVERFREVETEGDPVRIWIEWDLESNALFDTVAGAEGTVMTAAAIDRTWRFRLRFPNHRWLGEWYRRCTDQGVSVTIDRVHPLNGIEPEWSVLSLTAAQREALAVARNRGYFEVPREVTLEELGTELGVSDTAVSQRLRRGIAKILVAVVNDEDRRPERNVD